MVLVLQKYYCSVEEGYPYFDCLSKFLSIEEWPPGSTRVVRGDDTKPIDNKDFDADGDPLYPCRMANGPLFAALS
jgi:hypothetical protein